MSDSIRQSNIFGKDFEWDVIYEAFKNADFTSYDYDSIYRSMTQYIREKYGDDFNDFIRSSEVFAHVNMMSFLGQNLSMRMDVNAQDNYITRSKRRDNIINMAYMLTFQPKRNRPARGLLKITGIETTEDVKDARHETLASTVVMWDQKGVFDWYDRFTRIIRTALDPSNNFGLPYRQMVQDGIDTHVYRLNQYPSFDTNYYFEKSVEGQTLKFNVVPSTIEHDELNEEAPDSRTPFSIVYRSDGKGNSSSDTGFFVQFKEGTLHHTDFKYDHPRYHRRELIDQININNDDVWVQEMDDEQNTLVHWTKVSSDTGQNIVYNEVHPSIRKVFFVKTRNNDKVELLFGDSNFADVPLGNIRTWYRVSSNIQYDIPREYIKGSSIDIPYIGRDRRRHVLTVYLTNVSEIDNVEVSPTNQDIVSSAPESRYTQDRMVNESDYNIYSSARLPFVRKLRVKNRDNSSKSRYPHLDTHDPTGAHSDISVNADDGYLYTDYYETYTRYMYDEGKVDRDSFTQMTIEELLSRDTFKNFYINMAYYRHHVADPTRFDMSYSIIPLRWMNSGRGHLSQAGTLYFHDAESNNPASIKKVRVGLEHGTKNDRLYYIRPGSKIRFVTERNEEFWTTVLDLKVVRGFSEIIVSDHVPNNARPTLVVPGMRGTIRANLREKIETLVKRQESFGLHYNFETDSWNIINQTNIKPTTEKYDVEAPISPNDPDDRWMIKCIFVRDITTEYYDVICRGERMIFGSERQVRFYFSDEQDTISTRTGKANRDYVKVLGSNAFSNPDLISGKMVFVSRTHPSIERF